MQKNNVFNQISLTHRQIELFNNIKRKGRDEQERQYLFPGLYGQKALTRSERGAWKNFEREVQKRTLREIKFRIF